MLLMQTQQVVTATQEHFAHRRTMAFKRRKQDGSNSEAPSSAKIDAVGESQFLAEPAARFKGDAELPLAVGEDGFHLRIAFEASRHVAHRRARGPAARHVARLILVLAGLLELLPACHKTVSAAV